MTLNRETPVDIDASAAAEPPAVAVRGTSAQQPSSSAAIEPFVFRLGVLSGITTDNFWAFYGNEPSVWNSYILGPTKPALFSLDTSTGSLTPELVLAQSAPTWNASGWRVRLQLNEAFKWSDGTPVTAHDYVFTFDTVRSLELGGSWADSFPESMASVHADSDYELRIEFRERPTLATWPHAAGLAPVMPKHVWHDLVTDLDSAGLYALSGDNDVSGGPLMLVVDTGEHLMSAANPGYPIANTPDSVEYHVYVTEEDLVGALLAGDIDSALTPKGLTQEHVAAVQDAKDVSVVANPANGIRYLGFNLNREPMSEHAFRASVALLLDRESLAPSTPESTGAAMSMIPRANRQWFDETAAAENAELYGGDIGLRLAKALEGLEGAGYTWAKVPSIDDSGAFSGGEGLLIDGRPPQPLTILTPGDEYDPGRTAYVQEIADTLAFLGFDARPVETDFDTVVDLAFTPGEDGELHYDMYMLGWTLGSPALPAYYRPLFSPDGVMNNTGYSSEAFTKALHDYEMAYSEAAARDALWNMEATLFADLPYLPLYSSQITEIYRSDRVWFDLDPGLGGLQARLGGIGDVRPKH